MMEPDKNSLELEKAWHIIESVLSLESHHDVKVSQSSLQQAAQILNQQDLIHVVREWLFESLCRYLRENVSQSFNAFYTAIIDEANLISTVVSSIQHLYDKLSPIKTKLDILANLYACNRQAPPHDLYSHAHLLYKAVLFSQPNRHFIDAVSRFYAKGYKAFDAATKTGEEEESLTACLGCGELVTDTCLCHGTMDSVHRVNSYLRDLDLLERISGEPVTRLIHERIKNHVEFTCQGNFEEQYLDSLNQWLDEKVLGWLELLYGSLDALPEILSSNRDRLRHILYMTVGKCRINELFNIIIDFPESEPSLQDLQQCLQRTDLRSQLVTSLKAALKTRLLHPGVNTADILTAYISAIRALRVLDSSGVLLDLVCEPVRVYLRQREDTVRCIVSSLTEEGSSELSEELQRIQPLVLDDSYLSDGDMDGWETWQPDPVDAGPAQQGRRSADILSLLVTIYGSRELFVNEYRSLLADRLLTTPTSLPGRERRHLELLKLRFGESQLQLCEVMLKDVNDSRRINSLIREQEGKIKDRAVHELMGPVNALVLSSQFWPTFREEKVKLPADFEAALDDYRRVFETLKANRTLVWKPHLGMVHLELELKDRTVDISVTPVHAAVIWHFQQQGSWSLEALAAQLEMSSGALRRKLTFWQSQGLIREDGGDVFSLVEDLRGNARDPLSTLEDDDMESALTSAQEQREEELQVLWSYVLGMLTNLESLSLDRIHAMLQMFIGQGSECTQVQLKAFLDNKVKEMKLVYMGGVYRLPKLSHDA